MEATSQSFEVTITNNPIAEKDAIPQSNYNVKLISSDNEVFELPVEIAILCKIVATGIEGREVDDEDVEIVLPFVKGATLANIVKFLNYHHVTPLCEIPKPLRTKNLSDAIPRWYADFIKMELEELFGLTLASNYVDCPPLLELCCAEIAAQIKGMKSCKEIANHFGLKREYKEPVAEDIERLRKKYPWMDKSVPV